jgi:hypothetical protein
MEKQNKNTIDSDEDGRSISDFTDEEKLWFDKLWDLSEAPQNIRSNKKFILEAVKNDGTALSGASDNLKSDRDVVMEAIKESGWALEYASDELKNDQEIVLNAVKNIGRALAFVSDKLKNNRLVVTEAVKNQGYALENASDKLRNDREIVLEAINEDKDALDFASDELKKEFSLIQSVKLEENNKKILSEDITEKMILDMEEGEVEDIIEDNPMQIIKVKNASKSLQSLAFSSAKELIENDEMDISDMQEMFESLQQPSNETLIIMATTDPTNNDADASEYLEDMTDVTIDDIEFLYENRYGYGNSELTFIVYGYIDMFEPGQEQADWIFEFFETIDNTDKYRQLELVGDDEKPFFGFSEKTIIALLKQKILSIEDIKAYGHEPTSAMEEM